jgi:hypothetical protein
MLFRIFRVGVAADSYQKQGIRGAAHEILHPANSSGTVETVLRPKSYSAISGSQTDVDSLKIHSGLALGIVAALGLMSATVIAVTTCMRYLTFTSPNFDFGLFVNMFHNMKETGLPLISSERDVLLSHFVVHISPTCYLLLPFYALFPSAMTLQIGQAVILASGIIPAILIARHYKLSNLKLADLSLAHSSHSDRKHYKNNNRSEKNRSHNVPLF